MSDQPTIPVFVVKDSGNRESFGTGAVRDVQDGKPRYDLIAPIALRRLADHLGKGVAKYGEHNWTLGIPTSRTMASLMRHVEDYRSGDRTEDHLAAIMFNAMVLMYFENTDLDDQKDWRHDRPRPDENL